MRKINIFCCLLLLTLAFGYRTFAQDTSNAQEAPKAQDSAKPATPPIHYYHLDFQIEELGADGKPVNSRTYSTSVSTDNHGNMSIRVGSKIPISTGSTFNDGKTVSTQFNYQDVGVDIDVLETHDVGRLIALNLTADVSGLAQASDANIRQPVIRQNRWHATVLIPVGKPTVIFTSDSIDSKGSTRVVVTATLLQ
jgi:hypothetical protein